MNSRIHRIRKQYVQQRLWQVLVINIKSANYKTLYYPSNTFISAWHIPWVQ